MPRRCSSTDPTLGTAPMTDPFQPIALVPILPEIVLSAGAMLLLMVGVFGRERSSTVIDVLAILLLVAAGAIVAAGLPEGRLTAFSGSYVVDDFARFLKLLALTGSAVAILM